MSFVSLDDVSSVTALGGTVSTVPTNDFVAAQVGNGLKTDAVGERALIPQLDGANRNIETEHGTIEFWFRPDFDHTFNFKYTIIGTGTWKPANTTTSSWHFGHHNQSNGRELFLIFNDANSVRWEHNVALSNYSWNAGEWKLFRITWDFTVPAGEQNLHVYMDGTELPLRNQVARGPQPVHDERSTEMIYVGSRDLTGSIPAAGVYDEVRIWDTAIPPS